MFNLPAMSPAADQINSYSQTNLNTLPPGWRKVPSRSRPGEFSYEEIKTGNVYKNIPSDVYTNLKTQKKHISETGRLYYIHYPAECRRATAVQCRLTAESRSSSSEQNSNV